MSDGWVDSLITGGVGAAIGGIVTAIVQVLSTHGESRANAAAIVTKAAGSMVDRLDQENKQLREAVLLLTDVLDEIIPVIQAPPEALEKLKEAKKAAQRAV